MTENSGHKSGRLDVCYDYATNQWVPVTKGTAHDMPDHIAKLSNG